MLGVSAAMNYLFLSSLGKTPLEGQVLGAASAAADGLKALLPFFIFWGWRSGRYAVAVPGFAVWLFFSGFSLLSAIGFAADNRGVFSHTRENVNAAHETARAELGAAENRMQDIPKHRPVAVVTEDMERHKQDRRWSRAKECTEATLPESREYCARYYELRAELASGVESERLQAKIAALKEQTDRLRIEGAGQDADPQVSLLARVLGHEHSRVRLALIIVVALLVEIGSSLGLFLATSHSELFGSKTEKANRAEVEAEPSASAPEKPRAQATPSRKAKGKPVGAVEDFCLECLTSAPEGKLTLAELFAAYEAWCKVREVALLPRSKFEKSFEKIARQIGVSGTAGRYSGIGISA
ncbi:MULTISPECIES: hypothetical protein [Rhodomicrobium]|uniref:hypothetical protein n=1 Tax=Rhodomicrobium TaxID=1068 RepID=UPI000F749F1A|nr:MULTISPECIES: hypothetical protein [Rhodomicrobium]